MKTIRQDWVQPNLSGHGFVHLDATYWGHNWGVMLAVDSASGFPLYMSLIKHETIADYRTAVSSIEERGYAIRGIIIDMDIITKTTGLNEEELAADFDY